MMDANRRDPRASNKTGYQVKAAAEGKWAGRATSYITRDFFLSISGTRSQHARGVWPPRQTLIGRYQPQRMIKSPGLSIQTVRKKALQAW